MAATGCELVFGLDDYARDPAGAGGGTTASGGAGGSEGGAGPSGGSTSSASTSVGSTSTAIGGPVDCQCVPPIPDGWSLVTRIDRELGDPEATCTGAARLAVGSPTAATCTCSCTNVDDATCQGARLKCYQEGGCVGAITEVDLDEACADLGAEYRSCESLSASPSGPPCQATATPGGVVGDAVDLCPASTTIEASCGGDGVCAAVEDGQRTCIRGAGSCPAGWTGQALDAHEPGIVTCESCTCGGRACTDARYLASAGPLSCGTNTGTTVEGECTGVAPLGIASSHAKRLDAPTLEGECAPEAVTVSSTYTPGAAVSVCCLPPPGP